MHHRIAALKSEMENLAYLGSAIAMLHWDQQVNMPVGAIAHRANQISYLESLYHSLHTGEKFSSLLGKLVDLQTGKILDDSLTALEKKLVKEAYEDYRDASVLPSDFVREYAKAQSESFSAWQQAKRENNYQIFAPSLEKMVAMAKEKARYLNPNIAPYDALIHQFEPHRSAKEYETLFAGLKSGMKALIQNIKQQEKQFIDLRSDRYSKEDQHRFIELILMDLKYDFDCGRQDTSEHPFSSSFHPTDSRITTHIRERDLMFGVSASMHECGHALYEQGLDSLWYGTALGSAASFGIHESQSRFYETRLGLSKAFWSHYFPILRSHFLKQLNGVSLEEFYESINQVTPGPIRLEADEISYNLHIIIRFELEKMMMDENLDLRELPEIWNAKYRDYLGVVPKNDSEGILQDVHWSEGYFGYFPSYVLGSIYASQMYEKMQESMPHMEEDIARGAFGAIREWLRDNIHSKGKALDAEDLMQHVTGKPLTVEPYLTYLKEKYTKIYGV